MIPHPDDFLRLFVLIGSAVLAGVINTVAGGGTLLTFPALLHFGPLSAVGANATSTVALVPGSLGGAWGYRRELAEVGWWLRLLLLPSAVGGAAGSLLVTRLPERTFDLLVPWLLLTASLLFLLQPWLSRAFHPGPSERPGFWGCAVLVLAQLAVSVYGGYFGAGIGILMISTLGLMGQGDIHRINAIKTVLGTMINAIAVIIFVLEDRVDWRLAWPMALGAVTGGYVGAAVGRRLPRGLMRWFVIAVGLGLAAYYFWKQSPGG